MLNRYAGKCACGTKVAKSRGTLVLVDDVFCVVCSKCLATDSAPARAARTGKAARTKSKAAAGRGRTVRSRRGKAARRPWIAHVPTDTACLDPAHVPNDHGTLLPIAGSDDLLPCSEAYGYLAARCRAAAASGDLGLELDLLFTLAEFSFFGHRGLPMPGPQGVQE